MAALAREDGIARVQLWTAAARQTPDDTAEMRSRGRDQLTAGALVVECLRRGDAERISSALSAGPPAELGIFPARMCSPPMRYSASARSDPRDTGAIGHTNCAKTEQEERCRI